MYIGLLLLLSSSGVLSAVRRPRQDGGASSSSSSSSSGGGGGFPGAGQIGQFQQFQQFQQYQQQLSNPNPQEFINNPQGQIPQNLGQQVPGGFNPQQVIGGQQQQQQQQQQTFFTNRNPPAQFQPQQQEFFVNRNPPAEPIPIISYENIQPGDGTYRYSYETGDGIKKEEQGEQRVVGEPPEAGTVAKGSYSYTDLDGNNIAVSYIADENGFQPSGSHLPTPPPIPEDIMKALELSAQAEANQNNGQISPAYHYFFRNFRRA